MGDDDRIPRRGRGARLEAMPLVLGKVGLVGDEDARAWIERQELARRLRQAMAGNDEHGLGDQAETPLFHDRGRHRHRLAGAHGMGEIGRARGDDAPDATLLMLVENECARGARQLQVRAVEGARHDVVEPVVVDPRQAIGSIRIGPDPVLEGGLDLVQLLLRRLGIDDVEDTALAVAILDGVEDLGHRGIERIGEKLAGVPPLGAPFGCAGGHPAELAGFHGPRRQFRHVVDLDLRTHDLVDESDDIGGGDPRRAEPRGDV